jgi:signal transduction histidine kinase
MRWDRRRLRYQGRRLATIARRFLSADRPISASAALAQRLAEESLAARLGGDAGIALGVLLPVLIALNHGEADKPTIAAVLGVGVFAFIVGVVLRFRPGRVPMPVMDTLVVIAGGLLVLLSRYGDPVRPALPGVYLMIGTIVFAVRSIRVSLVHFAVMGASYAGVLEVAPHPADATAQWIGMMSLVAVSGIFVRWIVALGSRLAVSEHEARARAEEYGTALAEQSLAKSTFISRMSHELRTPLNVVLGFADLLAEELPGPLNERQKGYVSDITSASRHLVSLVDDVLDLSSVEAGVIELEARVVPVADVIETAARLVRSPAEAAGVRIQVDLAGVDRLVEIDARKVSQVAVNLLTNAIKFTPPGGIVTVTARATAHGVRVIIRDEGTGIPPEEREQIFEAYQTSQASAGSGLGLPLSRRIIEAHGGRLELVHTAIGIGSVFAFELPDKLTPADDAVVAVPGPADDDPAYKAFADPDSVENQMLILRVGTWFALAAAFIEFAIVLVTPLDTGQRLNIFTVAIFNAATAVGMRRLRLRARIPLLHVWGLVGTVVISAGVWYAGPYIALVQLVYGWVPMVAFALWTVRRSSLHVAFIMVNYAVVLAVRPFHHKFSLWLMVMTVITFNGAIVNFLASRLRGLLSAEQAARREAERVSAELAATSRHKSEFLANMSHELRAPLNAIVGFADLLHTEAAGPLNTRQAAYVEDIRSAARRLTSIINDVLDLARLEAGKLSIDPQLVAVQPLLELAGEAARTAADGKVEVRVRTEPGLDLVIADGVRLQQVLNNLAVNAVKFTAPGGRVDVNARLAGPVVQIEVSDTGIGILPEQQVRVFDPFHQGTRMIDGKLPEGTGLGLSLAKSLIELHGGRIKLRSVPDHGSTFTVELPVDASAATGQPERNPLVALAPPRPAAQLGSSG